MAYSLGSYQQRMPPTLFQKFLHYLGNVLGKGVHALTTSDEAESAVQSFYDWLAHQARPDVPVHLVKMRPANTYWGSKPIDWKHDPLYSVGHNQDAYVAKLLSLKPVKRKDISLQQEVAPVLPLQQEVAPVLPLQPSQPSQLRPLMDTFTPEWQYPAPVHAYIGMVKYKNKTDFPQKTQNNNVSFATSGWNNIDTDRRTVKRYRVMVN